MGGEGDFTELEPEGFRDELEKLRDSVPSDAVESDDVTYIEVLTQSEYDDLDPPDEHTFYIIVEDG